MTTITQKVDMYAVSATPQISARWARGGTRSKPKAQSPMKVDSRKNATMVSTASGAPTTLPMTWERPDQFRPNWNSWVRPLTMPSA